MGKKYLKKNEIRADLNPAHFNKFGSPHDAYITAKRGKKLKANTRTHSKYVDGILSLDLEPELPDSVRHRRASHPFWQNEKQFGAKKSKIAKRDRRRIINYNKKFYK